MDWLSLFRSIVLGVVQGLTEFLPVSSSGHLLLVPWLFQWPDPGLAFDVALHLGTLVAVIAAFAGDWIRLLAAAPLGGRTQEGRLFWSIILATIPGAVGGYLLEDLAHSTFRAPLLTAAMLALMGLLLLAAEAFGSRSFRLNRVTWREALIIGIAQAFAVIPGVSRSGITIAAALGLGFRREDAARFSFLLSAPIILGAGLLEVRNLPASSLNAAFFLGVGSAAITGFLAIRWLLGYVRSRSYGVFVVYRLVLAAAVAGIAAARALG